MRKQVYLSEIDTDIWADFKAAVSKKYGGLRRVRGRSFVSAAVEGLMSRFIVDMNNPDARAREKQSIEKDKFDELLKCVSLEGSNKEKLVNQIMSIWGVRQPRTIKSIRDQFFLRYGFSAEFVKKVKRNEIWAISKKVGE